MFLQGACAFAYVAFLPGFIFLKLISLRMHWVRFILFAFALSLTINYLITFFLTAVKFHTQSIIFIIFLIELLVSLWLGRYKIYSFLSTPLFETVSNILFPIVARLKYIVSKGVTSPWMFYVHWVIIGLMGLTFWWVLAIVYNFITHFYIFTSWDTVVSWNRWALDWFHNILPTRTWHYPQLVPSNWASFYVFLGEPLQFFPRMIMPFFFLGILVALLDVGFCKRSIGYFLGVITTALFIFHAKWVGIELLDIPVAFMSFLPAYCLLLAQENKNASDLKKHVLLGSIFCASAAVTKQAGFFIFLMYPLLVYLLIINGGVLIMSLKKALLWLIWHVALFAAIAGSFYIYKEIQIYRGFDSSEVATVTHDIYRGSTLSHRFICSVRTFFSNNLLLDTFTSDHMRIIFEIFMGIFCLFLVILACKNRSYRILFLCIVLPYSLIWSLFYCYDMRNYSLAFGYYGLGLGLGIHHLLILSKKYEKIVIKYLYKINGIAVLGVLFLGLFVLQLEYPRKYLLERQKIINTEWRNKDVNEMLLKYHKISPIESVVVTDYPLNFIMVLSDIPHKRMEFYTDGDADYCGSQKIDDSLFVNYIKKAKQNNVGYFLVPNKASNLILDDIKNKLVSGQYKLIFDKGGYQFIKIISK